MTDIEQKALAQAVAAAGRRMQDYNIMSEENVLRQSIDAHARAIEQHEAFRREVSDAVREWFDGTVPGHFQPFIIAKPDPLVEALEEWINSRDLDDAASFRAAIEKRGGKIIFNEEQN